MTKDKLLAILNELETDLKDIAEKEKEGCDYPYLYGYLRSSVIHAIALTEGDMYSNNYNSKRNTIQKLFE